MRHSGIFFSTRMMAAILLLGATLTSCLPEEPTGPTLWEALTTEPEFSTYVTALERMGYDAEVQRGFDYTLFAPTNDAFEVWLNAGNYTSVTDVPLLTLKTVMLYHMQIGEYDLTSINEGYMNTLCGVSPDSNSVVIRFQRSGNFITLNDTVQITRVNIETKNGLINEIDAVMALPRVMDLVEDHASLSILEEAIRIAGMASALRGTNEYTLLAPSNSAFETFFSDQGITGLDELTVEEVTKLVKSHLIGENIVFREVINAATSTYTDLAGGNITLSSYREGEMIVNNTIGVPVYDIQGRNGVLHTVSKVLNPF